MRSRYAGQGWALSLRGLWMYAASLALLQWPAIVEAAFATLFGIFMVADAIIGFIFTFRAVESVRPARALLIIEGFIGLMVGAAALCMPQMNVMYVAYLIAGWAVTTGTLRVLAGLDLRRPMANSFLLAFSGGAAMICGVCLFAFPVFGIIVALQIIGAYMLVGGTALLSLAFQMYRWLQARREEHEAQFR